MASWLKPGPIYVKRHVRNKHEPLVDEAELIELNPNYAHVRMQDGQETTVFIRDLSPHQSGNDSQIEHDTSDKSMMPEPVIENNADQTESANSSDSDLKQPDESVNLSQDNLTLRRSTRVRKPVDQYGMVPYVLVYSINAYIYIFLCVCVGVFRNRTYIYFDGGEMMQMFCYLI